jgi:hypothetical protein
MAANKTKAERRIFAVVLALHEKSLDVEATASPLDVRQGFALPLATKK